MERLQKARDSCSGPEELSNPSPESGAARSLISPSSRGRSNLVPSLGNFITQYNYTSASIAVDVINSRTYLGRPLYEEPRWSAEITLAVVFIGAMIGMLVMGRLGDVVGRARALQASLLFAAIGAFLPALAVGSSDAAFSIIALGRLVLGVGVGGSGVLSAVASAETGGPSESRGQRVAWALFWQAPGIVAPYVAATSLFAALRPGSPSDWVPQLEFRLLFALGAIPSAVVFLASLRYEESDEFRRPAPASSGAAVLRRELAPVSGTLLGTSGAWFFYDLAYYGTYIFTPSILGAICMSGTKVGDECQQTLYDVSWQSCIVTLMGVPGCLLAVLATERLGSRRLNCLGFLLLALNFAAMAAAYMWDESQAVLLFLLLGSLNFLLQWGPNVGTYVLPAICFPAQIRSTCHGLSAFSGKVGAVVGTLLFPVLNRTRLGLTLVFSVQAAACLSGALISARCLSVDAAYGEGPRGVRSPCR